VHFCKRCHCGIFSQNLNIVFPIWLHHNTFLQDCAVIFQTICQYIFPWCSVIFWDSFYANLKRNVIHFSRVASMELWWETDYISIIFPEMSISFRYFSKIGLWFFRQCLNGFFQDPVLIFSYYQYISSQYIFSKTALMLTWREMECIFKDVFYGNVMGNWHLSTFFPRWLHLLNIFFQDRVVIFSDNVSISYSKIMLQFFRQCINMFFLVRLLW
jgi:hypothetical protein